MDKLRARSSNVSSAKASPGLIAKAG